MTNLLAEDMLARVISRLLQSRVSILLKPVYKLYENVLWEQIKRGPIPKHVAIIPDGNRRWAREQRMDPLQGHEFGYRKIKEVLDVLWKLGVKVVTIYAMSSENCIKRSSEEREHLFDLVRRAIEEMESSGEIDRRRVRIKVFGRLDMIPNSLLHKIKEVEAKSGKYCEHTLNIALCYGGRDEIIEAVRRIASDVASGRISASEIDERTFRSYLYTSHLGENDEPDLVIRTSGEVRISNFLLWQIAYSELYFCEIYWPEFRVIDLLRAVRDYQRRERRFGA